MKKLDIQIMSYKIFEIKSKQFQWKKVIKNRFEDDIGSPWVRQLRNHYNYEMIFRRIKKHHNLFEVYEIVKKAQL